MPVANGYKSSCAWFNLQHRIGRGTPGTLQKQSRHRLKGERRASKNRIKMKLFFTFIVLAAVLEFCYCRLPVFQRKLDKNQICREKICKFTLTLRDEFSMTRRVRPGRIWVEGETYLLEMQNGKVIQKLGTYYRQPLYSDLENAEITNITDDVITADGVRRSLVTINDVFPGPTFEVMEGSEV